MLTPKKLGKIIRDTRKKEQLTQAELAGLAGIGIRFISELERGKETCELGKTLTILNMLGLSLSVASLSDD